MTSVIRRVLPVVAATLLVACGGGSDRASTPNASAPSPVADTSAPAADGTNGAAASDATAVPAALQFAAPLVGGGEIELGELAGRPVLLWFWAPW